jgi:Transposase IS66 family
VCWAHLARNFEGLVTRGGDGTHIGVWARSLYRSLFADRSAFVADRTCLRTYQLRTRQMQSGFGELLTQATGSADLRVRRICEGINHLWPALWTYLDVPGVEPTNNVAERAIRPAVLWRKGSFGTQSGSAWTCSPTWPGSAPRAWPTLPSPSSSPPPPDPRLRRTWQDQSQVVRPQITPVNGYACMSTGLAPTSCQPPFPAWVRDELPFGLFGFWQRLAGV